MDGTNEQMEDSLQSRVLSKNHELVGEVNQKLQDVLQEQEALPQRIEDKNRELMLKTMFFCEKQSKKNSREITDAKEWLLSIKKELEQHIRQKRRCEAENKDIYQFLENIFGMDLLHIFQISYEEYASLFQIKENDSKG